MVMIGQSISFSIYIVFISYMSLNVGSNIVLERVVQLEAVLHTEGYFADTALKARLFLASSICLLSMPGSTLGLESRP